MRIPTAPKSLGAAGRALWKAVLSEYRLSGADLALLGVACTEADLLAGLEPGARLGALVKDPATGMLVPNPAAVQYRLHAITLARILAALQVVGDQADVHDPARPQRRSGVRGVYALKAVE
jgi:hypothetical protein